MDRVAEFAINDREAECANCRLEIRDREAKCADIKLEIFIKDREAVC